MNARAIQRIRRAERRLAMLRRQVKWWSKASAVEKMAVLGEVREAWPGATSLGATECNLYASAQDYLEVCGWRLVDGHYIYRHVMAS